MLLPVPAAFGQAAKLYYLEGKDGLWGVRDAKGKVIIPARFKDYAIEENTAIRASLIFLRDSGRGSFPGYYTPGVYFNRKGHQTVRPYWYDNGPDYIKEGLFRFVENDKMGFADRAGKVVIPATHGYAEPFLYGYSFFCNACTFYRDSTADPEHNLRLTAGNWSLMDKTGKTLLNVENRTSLRITDSLIAHVYAVTGDYECGPARVSAGLPLYKAVPKIDSIIAAPLVSDKPVRIVYRVVETSRPGFPYRWIAAYYHIDGEFSDGNEHFLVQEKTGQVFHYSPGLPGEWEPVAKWVKGLR